MIQANSRLFLVAVLSTVLAASPAVAGEVTGNGDQIDAPGNSICKFSGKNDGLPPPGVAQSYGQNVANDYPDLLGNPNDPTSLDPDGGLQFHPGWICNPNNFDAPES